MAAVRLCNSLLPSLSVVRKVGWTRDAFSFQGAFKTGFSHTAAMSTSHITKAASDDVAGQIPLANKRCLSCETNDIKGLTEEAAKSLLSQTPEWEILDLDGKLQLQRSWKSKNFLKGLEFFQRIGEVAELEGHHPDLHLVGWNKVTVNIYTHSIGSYSLAKFFGFFLSCFKQISFYGLQAIPGT
ncbi:4a-hydroxytetrahydrobiopterin dehydratase [Marchantia polymorpha subsp. ruderalis]|uniref:4a-hydroxytetrahydrobiopterin dehydratase n=2 Tax=Marchantia polymorpha TaxID=3197 RepID=A0AAF6BX41_MARPO|nr:hypothetical protein MARPO_0076s0047 [Marchantia polymorpha]BBN16575.1 hypothetical protein Mp_7g07470 [Marchantia polymorpha subsp. ruderalis]|eukprot:PTQ34803.1 hypothetical protein MARPO_0076s0047 [Marchantia polymorpha]